MKHRYMRSIAWLLIAVVVCIAVGPWGDTALAAYSPVYARCNTNNLRIRKAAGTSGAIQDYLMNKDVVWVVNEKTSSGVTYFNIEYVDQYGQRKEGWVAYKDSKHVYFHKFTDSEMRSYSYSNGSLPGSSTGGSSSSGSGSSSSSSSSGNYGYLKLGSKGTAVKNLQQALKDMNMYSGEVSGSFGQKTEDAVKAFQRKKGLYVDGIAGPSTQAAIFGTGGGSSSGGSSSTVINDASNLGLTSFDKVHLRSSASTSGTSKSLLPRGTVFEIISHSRSGNDVWYYVKIGSSKGYIRSDMIHVMTAAEAAAYNNGQSVSVPGATVTTPPSSGSSGNTNYPTSGMVTITGTKVNIRSGAGTSNSAIGRLNKGDVLTISSNTVNSLGELWYYLTKGSVKGHVRQDFVRVMTQAEIDAYNGGSSGSSSGSSGSSSSGSDLGTPSTYRTLKQGSSGTDVKQLQQKLKDLGYYTGNVTGSYGSLTAEAVRKYQKAVGLYVDGIAGVNTQTKLYGTSSGSSGGSSGGSTTSPNVNGVYMPSWNDFKSAMSNGTVKFPNGGKATLTDVRSGKSFTIVKQSAGYHLDVEPATAADTAVLTAIYNGNITYLRRPVWLTVDGKTYAGSIYAVGHGTDTISGNNYTGQFCIHMLHSKTHVGNQEDADHQACVKEAYNAASNRL